MRGTLRNGALALAEVAVGASDPPPSSPATFGALSGCHTICFLMPAVKRASIRSERGPAASERSKARARQAPATQANRGIVEKAGNAIRS